MLRLIVVILIMTGAVGGFAAGSLAEAVQIGLLAVIAIASVAIAMHLID